MKVSIGLYKPDEATIRFRGKEVRFEIGCHLPTGGTSHYTAGMKGQLIVK